MKLFLASEAKHPLSIKRLRKFVDGDFSKHKIAYIPTAANGVFYGSWKESETLHLLQSLKININVLELESNYYQNIKKAVKDCSIIWFSGGMSGYLLYWIRRVELDKYLPELLDNGVIYVGSSAGSMICSKTQNLADWYLGEPEPGASVIPGLGLIDFEIFPHYTEDLYPEINKRWKKGKLCLLKNGDVVTKVDEKTTILGEENYIVK